MKSSRTVQRGGPVLRAIYIGPHCSLQRLIRLPVFVLQMGEQVEIRIPRNLRMRRQKRCQLRIIPGHIFLVRQERRIVRNDSCQGRAQPQQPNQLGLRLRNLPVVGYRGSARCRRGSGALRARLSHTQRCQQQSRNCDCRKNPVYQATTLVHCFLPSNRRGLPSPSIRTTNEPRNLVNNLSSCDQIPSKSPLESWHTPLGVFK